MGTIYPAKQILTQIRHQPLEPCRQIVFRFAPTLMGRVANRGPSWQVASMARSKMT